MGSLSSTTPNGAAELRRAGRRSWRRRCAGGASACSSGHEALVDLAQAVGPHESPPPVRQGRRPSFKPLELHRVHAGLLASWFLEYGGGIAGSTSIGVL